MINVDKYISYMDAMGYDIKTRCYWKFLLLFVKRVNFSRAVRCLLACIACFVYRENDR